LNWNIRIGGSIPHDFYTGIERMFESIASAATEKDIIKAFEEKD
jgi:hypothetical protein